MPYSNDEIKKWLDDAVKKIQASPEKANPENVDQADVDLLQEHGSSLSEPNDFIVPKTPGSDILDFIDPSEPKATDSGQQRSISTASLQKPAPTGPRPATSARKPAPTGSKPSAAPKKPADTEPKPPAVPQKQASARPRPTAAPRKPGANQPGGLPAVTEKHPAKPGISADMRSVSNKGIDHAHSAPQDGGPEKHPDDNREFDVGSADFKIKFDFDSAYRDVPEEKPLRLRRERRTGCVGGLLYSVFVICISLVLASLAWMAASDIMGFVSSDEEVNVIVPKGFTVDDIADALYDAGLIRYKFLFKIYAEYSHAEDKIAAGSYILNKNYDYRALVYGMTTRNRILVETTVTIPEGFTLAEIFSRLDDYGVCAAADLWETAADYDFNYGFLDKSTKGERLRLEGYMFPETYNFYLESSPVQVIAKFLDEFDLRFTDTFYERAEFLDYSVHDIITIASMIEREAGSDEERPRIAAVIYNRLNNAGSYPYLQIDATLSYAVAGTDRPPTTDVDSVYNTYLHEGLPPGPIANPGIESIRAALYPDSTDEYFYALNKQGTHAFFRTLAQHEAFVASDDYGGR